MAVIAKNNLVSLASSSRICTAFGIKICRGGEVVQIAKSSGYDSLFIDLEHTCMTLHDASQICITAISAGVTPFVRVPHECGAGFIQKTLDVGAMGVIIPHIHGVEDAKRAIQATKYPPTGKRSVSAGFPHFEYATPSSATSLIRDMNELGGSQCFLMIETREALASVDAIAALPGCDVLLVGCQDLATELGVLGDWDAREFREALDAVGDAARRHGKIMGIAGLYHRPDVLQRAIRELGARWIVGAHDVGLLSGGGRANSDMLRGLEGK